eukprot:GDKK01042170.1.p1 GENE.GDKK01042170.1~~GDKK01042170.1.p1  ORF type:complete len:204 (+),score=26.04 GDKK01042170.1:23-613(+)
MGGVASKHNSMPQSPVPAGKIRICVASFNLSRWGGRAHHLAAHLAKTYPDKFESWYYFDGMGQVYRYMIDTFDKVPFPTNIKGHNTSPLVWLEVNKSVANGASAEEINTIDGNAILEVLGGCSEFQSWVKQHTAKVDGTAVEPAPQPLSPEEVAAKVARGPSDVLYFKEDAELSKLWNSYSFSDAIHVKKFGPQTA